MFFVTEMLIPHDFTVQFALSMNRELREQLAEELGIDMPLGERYVTWLKRLAQGSLGTSFYGYPVVEYLKGLIPYTLLVFFTGTLIAFLFGQWLGKVVTWQRSGVLTTTATFGAIALYTTFPPWLTFLVTYFLAMRINLFRPLFGWRSLSAELAREIWRDATLVPERVMLYMVGTFVAMLVIVSLINKLLEKKIRWRMPGFLQVVFFIAGMVGMWFGLGFGRYAFDILSISGLPILTYVLLSFGDTMLIMRTSMTDTLKEEYVNTARAKGLPSHVIRDRHAARNALLPVFSRLVISLPYLLTGLVIIEDVLGWPGISGALFNSLYQQDMPVVMGALLMVGVLSSVARLALDVMYAVLDPRVRHRIAVSNHL
ncbi:MAG TPA: ABC transporter permease [Chloroflexi bacterium]|nr:ABC transporter permease [Chloroflexota bacterium]